jgi:hypothetical protein
VGPYTEWYITHDLHATLRGGAVLYFFDSPPISGASSDLTSYYFGFEISHQLSSFFSHSLNVRRDVRQGLNQGSSYIQELNATYSASFDLTRNINLAASVSYVQGNQPFEVPVTIFPFGTFIFLETENYERYSGALTASWRATQKITASLSYSHWTRQSNLAGNSYDVNSLSATLKYNF